MITHTAIRWYFSSLLLYFYLNLFSSGQRDSNARHSPWQGDALPLSYARIFATFLIMSYLAGFVNYRLHVSKIIEIRPL
jgi:hypothetical protein